MKTSVALASLFASAFSLNAQITALLQRFPARSPEIEITNQSGLNLAAFAVSMQPVAQDDADRAPFLVFVDSAVDPSAMPLPPDQSYKVEVTSGMRRGRIIDLYQPPILTAGVFADGSTAGDAGLLARLIARRASMLQAVELAREILTDAGKHNLPRSQLIQQLQTLADSVSHWYLPPEQQVGRSLYQSLIRKLMDIPPLPPGSAFPPESFVQQETAALNRQRVTLLESQPGLARR